MKLFPNGIDITKKTVVKGIVFSLLLLGAYFLGAVATVPNAYKQGYEVGYVKALNSVKSLIQQRGLDFSFNDMGDGQYAINLSVENYTKTVFQRGYDNALAEVKTFLESKGIVFSWQDMGDGKYLLSVYLNGVLQAQGDVTAHLWIEHRRNGELLSNEFGAGVLTNIGKDWIEQQLAASDGAQEALYCADSNDATDPALATWTILPSEIAANGLDRQTGAYTSTGTGTWNVTVTKSVTGTQSTQLWGLHWVVTDSSDNNLLAADTTPAQKNCVSGDTLKETWQITVT